MCHRCVYTGSFELDYPRTLLAALHVHRIKIPYRAFPERVGPRILPLESVDYFGTTDHFMENVITFTQYWYLIKRTTNSAAIRANWINCVLYKVLLNLHIFPVLNIYCTEPYLGPVQRSYVYLYWQSHGPLIPIKIIVQFLEFKIPERVLLNGLYLLPR